jgi:hypothetical protein
MPTSIQQILGSSYTSGYSGISGFSGVGGGTSGYSGYSGIGTSGYSGIGTSGYSGVSGYSGPSGFSGYSGYSGYSGISGYSGKSGYSGAASSTLTLSTGLSNQTADGIKINLTYGESITIGDLLYIKSDGLVWKADANAAGLFPCNCLALATASSGSNPVLLHGLYRDDTRYNFTPGAEIYLSATAGAETATQPATSGDAIQVIGTAVSADILYFYPSQDYITKA